MLAARVGAVRNIDTQLLALIDKMRDCPCSAEGLKTMFGLLVRRDQLLEARHDLTSR